MQADVCAVPAIQEARCCSGQGPLQDRGCSGQQMFRTWASSGQGLFRRANVQDRGFGNNCALSSEGKGREGLTWLVEGNWLTSAMKFMTKGVAGRSKISFGVPTCSMRPLQYERKPSIESTIYTNIVHTRIHCKLPEGHDQTLHPKTPYHLAMSIDKVNCILKPIW